MSFELHHGDCLDVMEAMDPGSIDAIVTDPPYSLNFMGKKWDASLPDQRIWLECLRVLKPGGYLMAFGGTRTYHRLTCLIEDAGFEIRDSILTWVYGSGFPKSKGCLKPAWEPIVLARKPGKKVLPLGIEECKVGTEKVAGGNGSLGHNGVYGHMDRDSATATVSEGRWPPNLLLVHHPDCGESCDAECVVRTLGEQSLKAGVHAAGHERDEPGSDYERPDNGWGNLGSGLKGFRYGDTGTAARFYPQFRYCPKASRRDRNEGCEGNTHSCVKPTPLLEWLVRLACPEGGTVLDPFMGSGSTGKACMRAGRNFVGIERDSEWLPIARARLEHEVAACGT